MDENIRYKTLTIISKKSFVLSKVIRSNDNNFYSSMYHFEKKIEIRNILIGNQYAAEDSAYLAVTGVTHLVNTAATLSAPDCVRPHPLHLEELGIKFLNLEIIDRKEINIEQHFDIATAWMDEGLKAGGKVLVNCWQGASRFEDVI